MVNPVEACFSEVKIDSINLLDLSNFVIRQHVFALIVVGFLLFSKPIFTNSNSIRTKNQTYYLDS